ncbi:MAG: glycosyltransferase family 9 protein [Chloroherpetonaceae bacterium]|nr:glycosyltransferase family 9 protein [Chloroherpetonaceae bacterium]
MRASLKIFFKRLETLNKRFLFRFVLRYIFRNQFIPNPIQLAEINHVLILRNDVIGDMVITTAFINFLLDFNPKLKISVVTSSHAEPVLRYDKRLSQIFILERTLSSLIKLIMNARGEYSVTFALSLNGVSRDAILANLLAPNSIKVTYDIGWPEDREYYRFLFNQQITVGHEEWPLWKKLISLGESVFGVSYPENQIRQSLYYPIEIEKEMNQFLKQYNIEPKSFLLFNLSARLDYKKWGETNNSEFINIFLSQYPKVPVIISSAPEDRSEALRIKENSGSKNIINTPESFGLFHVMALAQSARVVFSPDTAVIHFAATFNTPSYIICTALASHPVWQPCSTEFRTHYAHEFDPVSELKPQEVFNGFQLFLTEKKIYTS